MGDISEVEPDPDMVNLNFSINFRYLDHRFLSHFSILQNFSRKV